MLDSVRGGVPELYVKCQKKRGDNEELTGNVRNLSKLESGEDINNEI